MKSGKIFNPNTLFVVSFFIFLLSSCEKRLLLSPTDAFSNDEFWTSEDNAMDASTGVYRGNMQMNTGAEFSPSDWWTYHGIVFMDLATDNAYDRRGDNSPINTLTNGTLTSSNGNLRNFWRSSYIRIARSNAFLENITKVPMDGAIISRMSAEARFLRASMYFYLSQYFGDVPVTTSTLELAAANTIKKEPRVDVEKYVETELRAAIDFLPWQSEMLPSERGRATKQAAMAFLGRVYLAEGKFADAADVYDQIINQGDNIIDPNYPSLFDGSNESSREIIFATQYLQNTASSGILQHIFPAMLGGWHFFCPLGSLTEDYDFTDGSPFSFNDPRFNVNNIGQNRDPRLTFNILWNGEELGGALYDSNPNDANSPDQLTLTKQATRTGFSIRKYCPNGFSGDLQNSGINIPIIRYAEILLSDLEAKLESGSDITQELLDNTINKVRERADVMMPPIQVTDRATLLDIVKHERRIELPFEGLRLWDLFRWQTAESVLNGEFYGASFPDALNLRKAPDGHVDPNSRWYVTTKHFRAQDYQWPVPLREVDINPNL